MSGCGFLRANCPEDSLPLLANYLKGSLPLLANYLEDSRPSSWIRWRGGKVSGAVPIWRIASWRAAATGPTF